MIDKIKNWFAINGKHFFVVCLIVFTLILLLIIVFILGDINYDKIRIFFNSNIGNTITNSLISLIGVLITGLWGNQRLEKLKNIYSSKQKTYEIVKKFFDKLTFEYVEYICTPTHYKMLAEQFDIFQIKFVEQLELNFLLIPDRIYSEMIDTVDSMFDYVDNYYKLGYFKNHHSGPEYATLEKNWEDSETEVHKQFKKLVNLVRDTYDIFNN